MRHAARLAALLLSTLAIAFPAGATFHLWSIAEVFSSADGRVQFVELVAEASGQQFLAGHTLSASGGGSAPRSFTFPSNLPGDSLGKRFLVGTASFAALGVVAPDYVVPDGFLSPGGGTVSFAEGADNWTYPALPGDGTRSLARDGTVAAASPRNFPGDTGTMPVSAADLNVQGLWWGSPAGSESGWGLNVAHQGTILFVTWFTYGADRTGLWLVMSDARRTAANTYAGTVYRTSGPAFSAVPFDPSLVTREVVGSATLAFTDADHGTFAYNVLGVTQSKPIVRMVYALPASVCTQGPAASP